MGYLASPPVLDAYGFLPDVLLAEAELQERAGARDGRRREGRSAQRRPLCLRLSRYPLSDKRAEWWDKREGPLAHPDVDYP